MQLCVDGGQRPLEGGPIQIRYGTHDMRQMQIAFGIVKSRCQSAALVVDQYKGHFFRTVIYG